MLSDLITYLNGLLTTAGYFDKVYPLAELIQRKEKTFPGVFYEDKGKNGEYQTVTGFDKEQGISYWRLSGPIGTANEDSQVSARSHFVGTYPLVLVCGIKRSLLGDYNTAYSHDRMSRAIHKLFKDNEANAKRAIGASRVTFELGSVTHDRYQIQSEEFIEVSKQVSSNYLILKLEFTVTVASKKACIDAFNSNVLAPSGLTSTSDSDSIDLSWTDNSSNETGFRIERAVSVVGPWNKIGTAAANATTYSDTDVLSGTTYLYRVRAVSGDDVSQPSNITANQLVSATCDPGILTLGGSTLSTIPSGDTEALTVQDQNANDITSGYTAVSADNRMQVTIRNTALPMKTGRTVSENANDDGDLERGRLSNFTTLGFNNPFGNTNRFTDTAGGQTFANAIAIDWGSWSQADEQVLGYAFENISKIAWSAAITAAEATSIGSFTSGWHLPNVNEATAICNLGASVNVYNYSPISGLLNAAQDHWTSTPIIGNPNGAYCIRAGQLYVATVNKTSFTAYWFAVRTFTLTELGL